MMISRDIKFVIVVIFGIIIFILLLSLFSNTQPTVTADEIVKKYSNGERPLLIQVKSKRCDVCKQK